MTLSKEEEDAALDRELRYDVNMLMNRLALMADRAKAHGLPALYYAINRAWREIDEARQGTWNTTKT